MKKIISMLAVALSLMACTSDPEVELTDQNVVVNLSAPVFDQSSIGLYKGVFTTANAKYRGTVEIRIPQQPENSTHEYYPSATIVLQTGKVLELKADQMISQGQEIADLQFSGAKASFSFSVNADGTEPSMANETYIGMESGIVVLKQTSLGPVTPITGTWTCDVCSPFMGSGQTQTFNMVSPAAGGSGALVTQTTLETTIYDGTGVQDSCDGPYLDVNRCKVSGSFDPFNNGNDLTWDGTHLYRESADGSLFFGNWSWQSNSNGVLSGSFVTDGVVATTLGTSIFFREDFQGFTGAGFAPAPTAGQLDSTRWIVGGLSDGADLGYGDTAATADTDWTRGTSNGAGIVTGGVYAFDFTAPATNRILGAQASVSDFDPGFFEYRVLNDTGAPLSDFYSSFELSALNKEDRAEDIDVYYAVSSGGTPPTFPADYTNFASFTSTAIADDAVETSLLDITFSATVPAFELIHIRFVIDDTGGTGFRDAVGIDNVILIGI